MKAGWGQNTDTRSHVTLVWVVRGVLRNKLRKHEELFVTLIVQSQIFLETTPAQSHWVNLSWGRNVSTLSRWFAETTSPLPEHPFPLQPSQARRGRRGGAGHQEAAAAAREGGAEAASQTRASEMAFTASSPFLKLFQDKRGSTLKYPHISSFKNSTSLFQRKKKKKRPTQPFPKKPKNNNNNNKKSY